MLPERADVAVEVVDDPVRAEAVRLDAALAGPLLDRDLSELDEEAHSSSATNSAALGSSSGGVFSTWLITSIESTPATAARVDHRCVLGLVLEQVGQGVAEDVVELHHRLGGRAQVTLDAFAAQGALAEPAERLAVAVHEQRDVEVGVGDLRARLRTVLAHADGRGLPQVDVAHALERQPLERAVGAHEVLHEVVGRVREQLGRGRVLGEHAAALQHRDLVAHLDRLVDVVGHEDDRLADVRLEAQELVLEPLAVDRVDGAERLVHEHQRRVGGQRPRHAHALLLAAGELARVTVAGLVRVELHQLEQLVHPGADPLLVPAEQARHDRDVVLDLQVREQADLLDRVADVAPQLRRVAVAHRLAVEQDVAARGLDHAVDHPHQRGLAAAGRAHQHADLARRDRQRQLFDSGTRLTRIGLGDVAEFEVGGLRAHGRPLGMGGVETGQE